MKQRHITWLGTSSDGGNRILSPQRQALGTGSGRHPASPNFQSRYNSSQPESESWIFHLKRRKYPDNTLMLSLLYAQEDN
ncbi:unnamed protein product [Caretta caretta]